MLPDTGKNLAPGPRFLHYWPLALILVLVALLLFGEKGIMRLMQLERQKTELQGDIRRVEGTNGTLREEIEALRTDPMTIEGIARRELGMVKKDEIVYQFRGSKSRTPLQEVGGGGSSEP